LGDGPNKGFLEQPQGIIPLQGSMELDIS